MVQLSALAKKDGDENTSHDVGMGHLCSIHPLSRQKLKWDICVMICSTLTLLMLPHGCAFHNQWVVAVPGWVAVLTAIDIVCLIDVFVFANTGQLLSGRAIDMRLSVKRAMYFNSFSFFCDVATSIPYALIIMCTQVSTVSLNSSEYFSPPYARARCVALLYLMRITKLPRLVNRLCIELPYSPFTIKIVLAFFVLLWFLWLSASLQVIVFRYGSNTIAEDAGFHLLAMTDNTSASEGRVLLSSIFNALEHYLSSTFMTPVTDGEIAITMFSQTCGTLMFTILYGVVISVVNDLFTNQIKHVTWEHRLLEYMKAKRLPEGLQHQIETSVFNLREASMIDEAEVLSKLPSYLQTEVRAFNCRSLLQRVPLFSDADDGFILSLVKSLRSQHLAAGAVVLFEGEIAGEMYFISRGEVHIFMRKKLISVFKEGQYFGESAVLASTKQPSPFTAVAVEHGAELYVLDRNSLQEILAFYPKMQQKMIQADAERHASMQRALAEHQRSIISQYIVGSTRFTISITTDEGSEAPGSIDAILYIQIFGAKGGSNEVALSHNDEFQQPFIPGNTDTFNVKFHSAVSDPLAVRLVYRRPKDVASSAPPVRNWSISAVNIKPSGGNSSYDAVITPHLLSWARKSIVFDVIAQHPPDQQRE